MPLSTAMQRLAQFYIDIPVLRPGTVAVYAFAFLCAAVATALGVAIDPHMVGVPFVTFIPAVIITTLISGFGAGLFCTVVSTALASFFVLPPSWSFNVEDVMEISVFILEALFYVIVITGMRLSLERYRDVNQKLEQQGVALRDNEQRLRLALNAAQLGSWQYDPLRRVASGDTRFKEIFDVADHETAIDEIVKRVRPDDMGRVRVALDAALDPADPKPLAIVCRAQREDGGIRWMEFTGLHILVVLGVGNGQRASSAPSQMLPNAGRMRKRRTFSRAKSTIVPRICSASWTRSPTRSLPAIPNISLSASPSASRRSQPIRTFLSGTNGRGWRSRTWSAPNWPISPISWVLVSSCRGPSCF
jgi:PAS domain-containing protein